MLRLVERMVGKVKLALLSNTNPVHVAWFRPRLPVLERFDAVLLSCEEKKVKPERAFYEEALERTQTRAEEAAFFDDMQPYVDAAEALGIQARLFTDHHQFERDLAGLCPDLKLRR